jgi:hypothetical protein
MIDLLRPHLRGFKVPKLGEAPSSCRDAWRSTHRVDGCGNPEYLRVAIADGASTTSGSGLWGETLVEASVGSAFKWRKGSYRARLLARLRQRWQDEARAALPQPVSWFAEAALDRGAYSTLMKVWIRGNTWEAEGWGDSCLFHLRLGHPVRMLPNLEIDDFNKHPFLLASVPGHDDDLVKKMIFGKGNLQRGDILLLATDALACWLLGTQAWPETLRELTDIQSDETFAAWVDELRRNRGLKNDDTTLVLMEFV